MDASRKKSQSGFTLIEMIVVIGVLGVLTGISLQTFAVYRKNAFYASSEEILRNARTALEIGLTNDELFPARTLTTSSFAAGSVTSGDAALIAPGLNNSKNSYVYVMHNPTCSSAWCLRDYITSSNCKAAEYTYWLRFANGHIEHMEHVSAGGFTCP